MVVKTVLPSATSADSPLRASASPLLRPVLLRPRRFASSSAGSSAPLLLRPRARFGFGFFGRRRFGGARAAATAAAGDDQSAEQRRDDHQQDQEFRRSSGAWFLRAVGGSLIYSPSGFAFPVRSRSDHAPPRRLWQGGIDDRNRPRRRQRRLAALGQHGREHALRRPRPGRHAATSPSCELAWSRPEGAGQFAWETFPIVVGRTMYYDTGTDEVFAVDAANGKVRWTYTPQIDFLAGPQLETSEPVSRGVTYGAGRIYLTTADDQLIALDAQTGKPIWKTQVVDPAKGNTMNSPGTFWKGELIVGGPAGDAGLRGFVAAYDATTGKQLWRTFVVPPPGKGWNRARGTHGGGDVWMPPVVDPQSGTAYVSTGNPTPGFTNAQRPGCNPFADATVALDAKTGKIEWTHTEVCNDSWDYDTVQAPTILDLRRTAATRPARGRRRQQVGLLLDPRRRHRQADRPLPLHHQVLAPAPRPTVAGHRRLPGDLRRHRVRPRLLEPAKRIALRRRQQLLHALQGRHPGAASKNTRPARTTSRGTAEQVGAATGVIAALDPATGEISGGRSCRARATAAPSPPPAASSWSATTTASSTRSTRAQRQDRLAPRPRTPRRLGPDFLRNRRRPVHRDRRRRRAGRSPRNGSGPPGAAFRLPAPWVTSFNQPKPASLKSPA